MKRINLKETIETIHNYDLAPYGYPGYFMTVNEVDPNLPIREQYYNVIVKNELNENNWLLGIPRFPGLNPENEPKSLEDAVFEGLGYLLSPFDGEDDFELTIDEAIDRIENPHHYTCPESGLTKCEFGFIKGEIAQLMYADLNHMNADDTVSPSEMSWVINAIDIDWYDEDRDVAHYMADGYVAYPDKEGKIRTGHWFCGFTEEEGSGTWQIVPEEVPLDIFPDPKGHMVRNEDLSDNEDEATGDCNTNREAFACEDDHDHAVKRERRCVADIDKIISTRKDITLHVYELPGTEYEGNFKLVIVDPDPDAKPEDQAYQFYGATADNFEIEHIYGKLARCKKCDKPLAFEAVETEFLSNVFSVWDEDSKPIMQDIANKLYRGRYFSSDEFYDYVYFKLINNCKGRTLYISKNENMLEFDPFGIVIDVHSASEYEDGSVIIQTFVGETVSMEFSEMSDLLERHVLVFVDDSSDEESHQKNKTLQNRYN